ncbi:hypothetical protein CASFOL_000542 [Castilleja foliolosa]|uniref:Uncharacterized protein n=1 Tax=Castilleja foliolosa TaxID=1961234 RepID=A0ABD3EKI0_9LAMI
MDHHIVGGKFSLVRRFMLDLLGALFGWWGMWVWQFVQPRLRYKHCCAEFNDGKMCVAYFEMKCANDFSGSS